jgi:hypothetical protein
MMDEKPLRAGTRRESMLRNARTLVGLLEAPPETNFKAIDWEQMVRNQVWELYHTVRCHAADCQHLRGHGQPELLL